MPIDGGHDGTDECQFPPLRLALPRLPGPGECSLLGCYQMVLAKRLCSKHYHEEAEARRRRKRARCRAPQCDRVARSDGLCRPCYRDRVAHNPCHADPDCPREAFAEQLCQRHYVLRYGRCTYGACESTDIHCMRSMLCRLHYNREHRKRKNERRDDRADGDALANKRRASLLRELPPAPSPPPAAAVVEAVAEAAATTCMWLWS